MPPKSQKKEFTWSLPSSRTEKGEQIIKKGSVPLDDIKLSKQYEERIQKKGIYTVLLVYYVYFSFYKF